MKFTRRAVLAALPMAAAFSAPAGKKLRLGGPIFLKGDDPRELAREHRRLGYSAAYCPKAEASDTAKAKEIAAAFAAENVILAEVGAWKNMLEPDAEKRKANLSYVVERLALAEAVGTRCCVNTAGSFGGPADGSRYSPDPRDLSREFFDATVENCRHVIDEVKPVRTKFSIEMHSWALPDGPDEYLKLLKAVDRKGFAVHLDPCNGINRAERYYHNGEFITECFRKLGPWIASCHAKDLLMHAESNIHIEEVIPGRGKVDYRAYLTGVSQLPSEVPFLLEHLKTPEEYDEGKKHIQAVARELGLTFA
jgi:sugar phosphate isomerase/epimerase